VADAFVRAAATPVSGALNIATGRETSVAQLADFLGVEVLHGPGRVGEIPRSCLDPTDAARRLRWSARTSLQSGLTGLRAGEPVESP